MLKIVADENIPQAEQLFSTLGEVVLVDGRQLVASQLKNADILLVRSVTQVNEALLAGSSVRFVATATIGTDHIDSQYLQRAAIPWVSAPGCNSRSVAEYILSVICRLEGQLQACLQGALVGIVGMGNVGSSVYRLLSGLGIRCVAYDPLIPPDSYSVLGSLEALLAADIICLHTPLTTSGAFPTRGMINRDFLWALKTGTVLINAGRGGVIDQSALKILLQQGAGLQVVLDVWEKEPAIDRALLPLLAMSTPHIAGYSVDGKVNGTEMIYQACCQFLNTEPLAVAEQGIAQGVTIDDSYHAGREAGNAIVPLAAALRQAMLSCYDVREDSQRMLKALGVDGLDSQATGQAFDGLRKHYPARRELANYFIENAARLDEHLLVYLQRMGFALSP